jgi:hypothetical protein
MKTFGNCTEIIDENRQLKVCTAGEKPAPKHDQTLISLVDRVPGQDDTA